MKLIVFEEDTHTLLYVFIVKKGVLSTSVGLKPRTESPYQPGCIVYEQGRGLSPIVNCEHTDLITTMYGNVHESYLCSKTIDGSNIQEKVLKIDRLYFSAFIKEVKYSPAYRKSVLNNFRNVFKLKSLFAPDEVIICLKSELLQPIDYSWSQKCSCLILEKMHLDSLMSWLSTLGGAFSALGDYDARFAEKAGVTSYKQMIIACRLGDKDLIARCWLYCALSLIQKKKFKKAERIIKYVHEWTKSQPEGNVDFRIFKMCQGIWTKLKYEHSMSLSYKNQNKCSSRQI